MNINRLLNASLDCVTKFRSSHYPLKTVASDVIRVKKLNSSERKVLLELVFAWSRESSLVHEFLLSKIRFYKSSTKQNQDFLALSLLANRFFHQDESTAQMAKEYESWLMHLGKERFLKALGFIGETLKKDHGDFALDIAEGLFTKPKKYLAFDERHLDLATTIAELKKISIDAKSHAIFINALSVDEINMAKLPAKLSKTWLMDAGSQIIAEFLAVKPGDQVLDMCVGEGGKALFITQKDCHYVAMDINDARLKVAKERLLGRDVQFIHADACSYDFKGRKFDWILLDAPCSGMGVLRRNPDLIYRLNQKDLSKYIKLQSNLLDKAVQLLKPQGTLIYATCSLFKAENEEQIERVLRNNKEIMALPLSRLVGERLGLSAKDLISNCLTLYPHIHDCDGFFFAALTKTAS